MISLTTEKSIRNISTISVSSDCIIVCNSRSASDFVSLFETKLNASNTSFAVPLEVRIVFKASIFFEGIDNVSQNDVNSCIFFLLIYSKMVDLSLLEISNSSIISVKSPK